MLAKMIISTGLILNIVGAGLLAWDLILTKTEAIELAKLYFPITGDHDREIRKLSHISESLRVSRNAQIGLGLMVVGFFSQLVGNWLTW